MQELNNYLDTFKVLINDLIKYSSNTNNVRLGGSLILKVHGLNFSRPIGDLDIIITNPTKEQEYYLEAIKMMGVMNDGYTGIDNIKFKKNSLIINILIIRNHKEYISPMFYKYNGYEYGIVSINEILNAKKQYNRSKDIKDFLMLKNENFNI
jgi:hypothetical protein